MGSDSVHKTRNNSGSLWSVFRSCVAVAGVVLLLIVTRPPPATPADKREAVAHHRKLIADEKDGAVTLVDEDAPPALLGKSGEPPMARGLYRFTAEARDVANREKTCSSCALVASSFSQDIDGQACAVRCSCNTFSCSLVVCSFASSASLAFHIRGSCVHRCQRGQRVWIHSFEVRLAVLVFFQSVTPVLSRRSYAGLQKLYEEFGPQGFTVLAFPCNAFSNQEPGTNEEIKAFAEKSGATFPLFAKIDAVNGADASPIYAWLHAQPGGEEDVEWNVRFVDSSLCLFTPEVLSELTRRASSIAIQFVKYLISSHGHVLQRYGPAFDGAALRADILDALKEAHEEADAMRHQHR